MTTPEGKAEGV